MSVRGIRAALQRRSALPFVVPCGAAALWLAIWSGARHDYSFFLGEWAAVMEGGPQATGRGLNAYGPGFNAFAVFAAAHPLLPKLIFVGAWLAVAAWLIRKADQAGPDRTAGWIVFVAVVLNPLFWTHTVLYGTFDSVVALACLGALGLMGRGRDGMAGASLSVAVLLKYYPLALVPFFAFHGRRFNRRFTIGFVGTTVAGLLLAFALWGPGVLHALEFAAERPSKLMSVFRFLRGSLSPLRFVTPEPDLDFLSVPLVVACGFLVWVWTLRHREALVPSTVLAMLTALTLYKVGHLQFQIVLVLLLTFWYVDGRLLAKPSPRRDWRVVAYVAYVAAVSAAYEVTRFIVGGRRGMEGPFDVLRDLVGLPAFLLACALVAVLLKPEVPRASDDARRPTDLRRQK